MKILILGANGFLGSYLSKKLSETFEVIPITRKNLNLLSFNEVREFLSKESFHTVINCAIAGGSKTGIDQKNYKDLQDNISIFLNFFNNSNKFKKYINIGSGAEFDLTKNIELVDESLIFDRYPNDSYGYSKNLISRLCYEKNNFYTLRLFGCFGNEEDRNRLLKKYISIQDSFSLIDRYFDYISIEDFFRVVKFYILNDIEFRDINCVYNEKIKLSEFLTRYDQFKDIKSNFSIINQSDKNYTGNGNKLNELKINLKGLNQSLKEYKG
jgi:nucleoside-diphosphate-sugar epimerase